MRLRNFLATLPVLLLFLASCEFKPKGDNFKELTPIPPKDVQISIVGQSDTLIARSSESYQVNVICPNRKVVFYRIYIDGAEKTVQKISGTSFHISPLNFINNDGVYRMSIDVGINSASGSIAEQMGNEGYVYRKDFILAVLREQYPFYPELKFSRTNGTLKITMDVPSQVKNVKKILLSRMLPVTGGYEEVGTATGNGHFEINDPLYVGQNNSYKVETYISDPGGNIFVPYVEGGDNPGLDLPAVMSLKSLKGWPLIKWDKSHYPANCGGYRIYRMSDASTYELVTSKDNISDTVYEAVGAKFPGYFLYHLSPFPVPVPAWYTSTAAWNTMSGEATGFTGLGSFHFDALHTPTGPKIYYDNTSNEINEYNVETSTITRVISTSSGWFYTFSVSPNAKYVLAATGISNFNYLLYDLTSGQTTLIPSSQVIGPGAQTGILSIADNGTGSVITGNKVVVYDFLHQAAIAQQTLPAQGERTVISADAQYVLASAGRLYLYKLESGALQQKWSSAPSAVIKYFNFYPSLPCKAVMFIDQTFSTMNCESLAIEGSFNPNISEVCNIDFGSCHLLGFTNTDFRIYDPLTGALQFQNPTQSGMLTYYMKIKGNTVYYMGGWKLIVF